MQHIQTKFLNSFLFLFVLSNSIEDGVAGVVVSIAVEVMMVLLLGVVIVVCVVLLVVVVVLLVVVTISAIIVVVLVVVVVVVVTAWLSKAWLFKAAIVTPPATQVVTKSTNQARSLFNKNKSNLFRHMAVKLTI